jgi:hypothetical protein
MAKKRRSRDFSSGSLKITVSDANSSFFGGLYLKGYTS